MQQKKKTNESKLVNVLFDQLIYQYQLYKYDI